MNSTLTMNPPTFGQYLWLAEKLAPIRAALNVSSFDDVEDMTKNMHTARAQLTQLCVEFSSHIWAKGIDHVPPSRKESRSSSPPSPPQTKQKRKPKQKLKMSVPRPRACQTQNDQQRTKHKRRVHVSLKHCPTKVRFRTKAAHKKLVSKTRSKKKGTYPPRQIKSLKDLLAYLDCHHFEKVAAKAGYPRFTRAYCGCGQCAEIFAPGPQCTKRVNQSVVVRTKCGTKDKFYFYRKKGDVDHMTTQAHDAHNAAK